MGSYGMSTERKRKFRVRLARRDGARCNWCRVWVGEDRVQELTLDHVVPRALGGPNSFWNMVLACRECNEARGDEFCREFGLGVTQVCVGRGQWTAQSVGYVPLAT